MRKLLCLMLCSMTVSVYADGLLAQFTGQTDSSEGIQVTDMNGQPLTGHTANYYDSEIAKQGTVNFQPPPAPNEPPAFAKLRALEQQQQQTQAPAEKTQVATKDPVVETPKPVLKEALPPVPPPPPPKALIMPPPVNNIPAPAPKENDSLPIASFGNSSDNHSNKGFDIQY